MPSEWDGIVGDRPGAGRCSPHPAHWPQPRHPHQPLRAPTGAPAGGARLAVSPSRWQTKRPSMVGTSAGCRTKTRPNVVERDQPSRHGLRVASRAAPTSPPERTRRVLLARALLTDTVRELRSAMETADSGHPEQPTTARFPGREPPCASSTAPAAPPAAVRAPPPAADDDDDDDDDGTPESDASSSRRDRSSAPGRSADAARPAAVRSSETSALRAASLRGARATRP